MYKIKISSEFTESRYGIDFVRGVGETDNLALAERLAAKGISVEGLDNEKSDPKKEPDGEPAAEDPATAEKTIDQMTVAELTAYAAEKEIDLTGITVKADILARIKEVEGGAK